MNAPSLISVAAALAVALAAGAASAQEIVPPGPSGRGAFLIYGNFCGPGSRGPGYPPIDALDRACAHHDACSPELASGVLPTCTCNRTLVSASARIAHDPRAPSRTRDTARFISGFAAVLPCR